MTELTIDNTPWLLEQWARWALVNPGVSLSHPTVTPVREQLGSTLPLPLINDDQALVIDSAVARLCRRDNEMGSAVALYYLGGGNVSWVARIMQIHRKKADLLVKSGSAWVDAALEMRVAA